MLLELLTTDLFNYVNDLLLPHSMNGLIILRFYCKDITEKVGEVGIS